MIWKSLKAINQICEQNICSTDRDYLGLVVLIGPGRVGTEDDTRMCLDNFIESGSERQFVSGTKCFFGVEFGVCLEQFVSKVQEGTLKKLRNS